MWVTNTREHSTKIAAAIRSIEESRMWPCSVLANTKMGETVIKLSC